MKAIFTSALLISNFVIAQNTSIPDLHFEQYLINMGADSGAPDGTVLTANISSITALYVHNKDIADLSGIEDFSSLEILRCDGNLLTSLNLSENTDLMWLLCSGNQLSTLNVNGCSNLYYLVCSDNNLTTLNLAGNTSLAELDCSKNNLTSLDLSNSPVLTDLDCSENNITALSVSGNAILGKLLCADNMIGNLDVSQNEKLVKLDVSSNLLTSLDCHDNPYLNRLLCNDNNLQCLNARNGNNQSFYEFDATGNSSLTCIEVDDATWSSENWTAINSGASFSELCENACSSNVLGMTEPGSSTRVYPNPVSDGIAYFDGVAANSNYTLLSLTGSLIHSGTLVSNRADLGDVPAGVYFVQIIGSDQPLIIKLAVE